MVVQKQGWKAVIILYSEHGTSVNNIESQCYKFNLKARCLVVFDCRFNFSTDFNTLSKSKRPTNFFGMYQIVLFFLNNL